ncbi:MAG: hypothetical protein QG657_803 [Acidobacteriota bacterium]|nr:hypothetical protein [Acidobacteriota bacterium]
MIKKPLISVIVPVCNDPRVSLCIQSLLEQDFPTGKYEILVIDNNSTDSTKEILQRYESRIILLSESRQGSYAARNWGLDNARGSLVAFTDSDCIQQSDWLSRIADLFNDPTISAVQGVSYGINKNGLSRFVDKLNQENIRGLRKEDGMLSSLNTRNCAIRKEQLRDLRFDDNFYFWGDLILGREIVRRGGTIRLNEEMINWHCNIGSMRKYIKKCTRTGASLFNSLLLNPMTLKQHLSFLVPVFKPDFTFSRRATALCSMIWEIVKFYYYALIKNEKRTLNALRQITAISFGWGLNRNQINSHKKFKRRNKPW